MAEYIEREAAIAETRKPRLTDAELRRRLASIPAADVRPAVRGTWGHRWYCSNMSGYEYACSCSACGEPTYRMSLLEKMPNFCPNCGAWMEETGG